MSSRFITLICTFVFLTSACSDVLVNGKKKSKNDGKNATVEDGKNTILSVEGGSLSGASVNIPTGALEVGSVVNINAASTPESFLGHSGVSQASDPMSVTATSPSGEQLSELDKPMTLQLPIGAALHLADVEQTEENLCVFLNAVNGNFYVWRRDTIAIADAFVKFESNRFGVYQLFYCGQQELAAAKDAKEEKIAGSASTAILTLTVPAAYATGATTACAGVVSGLSKEGRITNSDEFTIYAQQSFTVSSTAETSVEIFGEPGSGLSTLSSEDEVYIIIAMQSSSINGCLKNPDAGDKLANFFEGIRHYGFRKNATTVSSGGLIETLGTGELAVSSGLVKVDTPTGATTPIAASGCLAITTAGDGEGGFTLTRLQLDATGKINGNASMASHFIDSSSNDNEVDAYLNTSECFNSTVDQSSGTQTGSTQPYAIIWRNTNLNNVTMVPTKFGLKTNNILALAASRACFQAFPTSTGNVMTWSTDDRAAARVFEYVTAFTVNYTNDTFYLPGNANNEYDAFIKPLSGEEACNVDNPGYAEENYNYSDFSAMFINPT